MSDSTPVQSPPQPQVAPPPAPVPGPAPFDILDNASSNAPAFENIQVPLVQTLSESDQSLNGKATGLSVKAAFQRVKDKMFLDLLFENKSSVVYSVQTYHNIGIRNEVQLQCLLPQPGIPSHPHRLGQSRRVQIRQTQTHRLEPNSLNLRLPIPHRGCSQNQPRHVHLQHPLQPLSRDGARLLHLCGQVSIISRQPQQYQEAIVPPQ